MLKRSVGALFDRMWGPHGRETVRERSDRVMDLIGEFDNKIITFAPQKATRGISDGVFIAIDAMHWYGSARNSVSLS